MVAKKKFAVLQILPHFMGGPEEKLVLQTAVKILENGFKSFVASSGGKMVANLYNAGARHFDIPVATKNPFRFRSNVIELRELLIKHNIDIIHVRSRTIAWCAYFAAKGLNIPIIFSANKIYKAKGKFEKIFDRFFRRIDLFTASSYYIADNIREKFQIDDSKINIVPNAIDIKLFDYKNIEKNRIISMATKLRIPSDKPIILVPGNIKDLNSVGIILDALRIMPKKNFICLFVGEIKTQKLKDEIAKLTKKYVLDNRVYVASPQNDKPALLALSDVVIASVGDDAEMAITSMEAQSMGRMTICNAGGSAAETLINGQTGWIVEANSSLSLQEAISEALNLDLPKRLYRSNLSRNHVEKHFSLDKLCENMVNIYSKFLR